MAYYVLTEEQLSSERKFSPKLPLAAPKREKTWRLAHNVLVVGLGGLGLQTVLRLKQSLQDQFGDLRKGNSIRFLAVDTDAYDLEKFAKECADSSGVVELCHLKLDRDDYEAVASIADTKEPNNFAGAFSQWTDNHGGCGGMRLKGRAHLMTEKNYRTLRNTLKQLISDMNFGYGSELRVHIVASSFGGTGGGLCVDLPYIIRDVAKEAGVSCIGMGSAWDAPVLGYIYMPGVFADICPRKMQNMYNANAYATLKEIDYYMNLPVIGETFEAEYPGGKLSSGRYIFDLCTLIDNTAGDLHSTQAIDTCVSHMQNLIADISRDGDTVVDNALYAQLIANRALERYVDNPFHKGETGYYTFVGISAVRFPTTELQEYIVGECLRKTLEYMEYCGQKEFYSSPMGMYVQDVQGREDREHYKGLLEERVHPERLIKEMMSAYTQATERLVLGSAYTKENIWDLERATDISREVEELHQRIYRGSDQFKALVEDVINLSLQIFRDPERGPVYLAELLTAEADGSFVGFYKSMDGYGEICRSLAKRARMRWQDSRDQLHQLVTVMQKPFRFERNLPDYRDLLIRIRVAMLEEQLCIRLAEKYYCSAETGSGLCWAIRSAMDRQFLEPVDVLRWLVASLQDNTERCREEIFGTPTGDNIFCIRDPALDDLKNYIRNRVEGYLASFDLVEYMQWLADRMETWQLLGESNCSCLESFRDVLAAKDARWNELFGVSWGGHLDAAYSVETQVGDAVRCIVNYLSARNRIAFDLDAAYVSRDLCSRQCQWMRIGGALSDQWVAAFEKYGIRDIFHAIEPDVIRSYAMCLKMPVWLHRNIGVFEWDYNQRAYQTHQPAFLHIDESERQQPPYRAYPPLLPSRQWDRGGQCYENPEEKKYLCQLQALLNKAKELGVLEERDDECEVIILHQKLGLEDVRAYLAKSEAGTVNIQSLRWRLYLAHMSDTGVRNCRIPLGKSGSDKSAPRGMPLLEAIRKRMQLTALIGEEVAWTERVLAALTEKNRPKTQALLPETPALPSKVSPDRSDRGAVMVQDVFISFSFKDQEKVEHVVNQLLNVYGITYWICTRDIRAGERYDDKIYDAIKNSRAFVLIQSRSAVESEEVPKEIRLAIKFKKTIIPFVIEDSQWEGGIAYQLINTQEIKVDENDFERGIASLADEIKRVVGDPRRLKTRKTPRTAVSLDLCQAHTFAEGTDGDKVFELWDLPEGNGLSATVNFEKTGSRGRIPEYAGIYYLLDMPLDLREMRQLRFNACSPDGTVEKLWMEIKPENKAWMHESFQIELTRDWQTYTVELSAFTYPKTLQCTEEITFVLKHRSFAEGEKLTGSLQITDFVIE